LQHLKTALADESAKAAKRGSLTAEASDAKVYDHLKKELLLSVAAGSSQSVSRRKSEKNGSISATAAATAAVTAAAAAAAVAKPDKGTRRLSSGFRNKPASLNVSAAGAAAKAVGDSLQAPIPTVTPKSQQEFRRRRLSYASQRTQSSNTLPIEGSDKSVLIYQSREMGEADATDRPLPLPPAVLGTYSCHGIEPSWQVSSS
jgi:hypothetical protein